MFLSGLLSPPVLCFGLGALSVALRSNLRLPIQMFDAVSIYLLLAIGLKGGAELSETHYSEFALPALAALALGMSIPVWTFFGLRRFGGFGTADAASLAAHYGSVSAVTFIAVVTWLDTRGIAHEGFMTTLLALMEAPAIIVSLVLARLAGTREPLGHALREVLGGKSILLLAGGLIIGAVAGKAGLAPVKPFFGDLFLGFLCLFLLELGIVAAQKADDAFKAGPRLLTFALLAPPIHGFIGVALGLAAGLSEGGAIILGTLAASASYIAAPAAIRIALPEANTSYSLGAALAITFPFNLIVGIPLYAEMAHLMAG